MNKITSLFILFSFSISIVFTQNKNIPIDIDNNAISKFSKNLNYINYNQETDFLNTSNNPILDSLLQQLESNRNDTSKNYEEQKSITLTTCLIAAGIGAAIQGVSYSIEHLISNDWDPYDFAGHVTSGACWGVATIFFWVYEIAVIGTMWDGVNSVQGVTSELGDLFGNFFENCVSYINSVWDVLFGDINSNIQNNSNEFNNILSPIIDELNNYNGGSPNITSFDPKWADFNNQVIVTNELNIYTDGMEYNSTYGASWRMLYFNNSSFSVNFYTAAVPSDVTLTLTHLTSYDAGIQGNGYSPIDIYINGTLFLNNYDVALAHGGSHSYEIDHWEISEYLITGTNTIYIYGDNILTRYWINNLVITQGNPVENEPDLIVQNTPSVPSSAMQGENINISCIVENIGDCSMALEAYLGYYISTTQGGVDILLSTDFIPALSSKSSHSHTGTVFIPNSLSPGYYWITFFADYDNQINESIESNNINSVQITIKQQQILSADFEASANSITVNTGIYFSDLSIPQDYITSWQWNFGDGNTSNLQNPYHVYTIVDNYTVSLIISDGVNYETKTKINYITVNDATTYFLSVNPESKIVNNNSGAFAVDGYSNINWTVNESCDWIEITSSPSGSNNDTFTVSYDENHTTNQKSCIITVSGDNGVSDQFVVVNQQPGDPVIDLFLIVSPANQDVSSVSGITTFNVNSNITWAATYDASWITALNPQSDNGNNDIMVYYESNTNTSQRIANITVSGSDINQNVTITQEAISPELSISPYNQNVSYNAGTTTFAISSNINWTAVSNSTDWLLLNPENNNGSENIIINAYCNSNTSTNSRTATITIFPEIGSGISIQSVTVTQAGSPAIVVSPSIQNVGSGTGNTTFIINSNIEWCASDNVEWLALSSQCNIGDGAITTFYTSNLLDTSRTAIITFFGSGVSNQDVTLIQEPTNVLNLSPINQIVTYNSGNTTFSINSNIDWIINYNSDWLILDQPSGNGDAIITVNSNENTTNNFRISPIFIYSYPDSFINKTIIISQEAVPNLSICSDTIYVDYNLGDTSFAVLSNIDWLASYDALWITSLNPSSGNNNEMITAYYEENSSSNSRTANIIFSGSFVPNDTVTIMQDGVSSINEKDILKTIKIYPNPANNSLTIDFTDNTHKIEKLSLYNTLGVILCTKEEKELKAEKIEIDLSGYKAGVYYLNIKTEKGKVVKRFSIIK